MSTPPFYWPPEQMQAEARRLLSAPGAQTAAAEATGVPVPGVSEALSTPTPARRLAYLRRILVVVGGWQVGEQAHYVCRPPEGWQAPEASSSPG